MKKEMKNPVADEKEDKKGYMSWRVYRGGCWSYVPKGERVSNRNFDTPTSRVCYIGFRIVRSKK